MTAAALAWLEPPMRDALTAISEPQRVGVVLYGEARSEPVEGLIAVGCVIRNRVKAQSWFGKTYSDVVTKKLQFSCLFPFGGKEDRNYARVLSFAQTLASKQPLTDMKQRECVGIAALIVNDAVRDVIAERAKGAKADHYHTATLTPRPTWATVPIAQIGGHVFYALGR